MKSLLCVVLVFGTKMCASQTLAEWTQQKKTQIAYLVEQVAALQVYIELGQKGYDIYRDGLQLVGDIKSGDFDLHKNYFTSLLIINPRIKESPEVGEAMQWLAQINEWNNKIARYDLGPADASAKRLFDELVTHANEYAGELHAFVSDDNYQLRDEERLTKIHMVYVQMRDLYAFARTQYNEILQLAQQRIKDVNEVKRMKIQLDLIPERQP